VGNKFDIGVKQPATL